MKKVALLMTLALICVVIITPLNAKTFSFSFGQEFNQNFSTADGQQSGFAVGTKMGFNFHFSETLTLGFISNTGNDAISWNESYLGFNYSLFDFVSMTFGIGQTTTDNKLSTRTGFTFPIISKSENNFFSNLSLSIESGFRQDISDPRLIVGLNTNFGF